VCGDPVVLVFYGVTGGVVVGDVLEGFPVGSTVVVWARATSPCMPDDAILEVPCAALPTHPRCVGETSGRFPACREEILAPHGSEGAMLWAPSSCVPAPGVRTRTGTIYGEVACPDGSRSEVELQLIAPPPGDCTSDGVVTEAEVVEALRAVFGDGRCATAVDLNLDGAVKANEIGAVIAHLQCPRPLRIP
jgi:hypothetical protein